jgi:hypothetical protein
MMERKVFDHWLQFTRKRTFFVRLSECKRAYAKKVQTLLLRLRRLHHAQASSSVSQSPGVERLHYRHRRQMVSRLFPRYTTRHKDIMGPVFFGTLRRAWGSQGKGHHSRPYSVHRFCEEPCMLRQLGVCDLTHWEDMHTGDVFVASGHTFMYLTPQSSLYLGIGCVRDANGLARLLRPQPKAVPVPPPLTQNPTSWNDQHRPDHAILYRKVCTNAHVEQVTRQMYPGLRVWHCRFLATIGALDLPLLQLVFHGVVESYFPGLMSHVTQWTWEKCVAQCRSLPFVPLLDFSRAYHRYGLALFKLLPDSWNILPFATAYDPLQVKAAVQKHTEIPDTEELPFFMACADPLARCRFSHRKTLKGPIAPFLVFLPPEAVSDVLSYL